MANGATPEELVFALCHEIGNFLAAARLEAGLLDAADEAAPVARAGERISVALARAGSLLAQVRPLLEPAAVAVLPTDPLDLLDGLRRGLDESSEGRLKLELKAAAELPEVALPPETLHHLLLTAIFCGLDSGGPEGGVRVGARAEGGRVVFHVEDEGGRSAADEAPELRGRRLTHAVSRTLLERLGAEFEVSHPPGRTRVRFAFPLPPG